MSLPPAPAPGDSADTDTGRWAHHPEHWLVDNWTATAAICEPPVPFVDFWENSRLFTDECYAQLSADLGMDDASFFAGGDDGELQRNIVLSGAFRLLGTDLGDVEYLRRGADRTLVRDAFIEGIELAADTLGQTRVNQLLYNIVTSTIWKTTYDAVIDDEPGIPAAYSRSRHEMYVANFQRVANYTNNGLVHEGGHGWILTDHVVCPDEMWNVGGHSSCDERWHGVHSYVIASASLTYDHLPPETDHYEDELSQIWWDVVTPMNYILNDWRDDLYAL